MCTPFWVCPFMAVSGTRSSSIIAARSDSCLLGQLLDDGIVSFDKSFGLDPIDLADGTFIWAETPTGLTHLFDLVAQYGLAGWAAWRFGFDSPEIWELVANP